MKYRDVAIDVCGVEAWREPQDCYFNDFDGENSTLTFEIACFGELFVMKSISYAGPTPKKNF